jgi:hypothetical protein
MVCKERFLLLYKKCQPTASDRKGLTVLKAMAQVERFSKKKNKTKQKTKQNHTARSEARPRYTGIHAR